MDQEQAMEILKMGYNVYLTGQPGSGKTFLLNKYINFLKNNDVKVGVTASTGIAATHLNGITIHSWSGIGLKDKLTQENIQEILKKKWLHKRIRNTKVLIIDEISMLKADQLDLIDEVVKSFKGNHFQPFGGMQVVLSGDFFQLPPVSKGEEAEFVTHSPTWKQMDLKTCYLTEQWRQRDSKYLKILNDIRSASVNSQTKKILKSRYQAKIKGNLKPINLYTHNVDVDQENRKKLDKIDAKPYRFAMRTEGVGPLIKMLKQGCLAPQQLVLKKGAPVMFVKNDFNKGYVNGTLGKVADFNGNKPLIKTKDNKKIPVDKKSWDVEQDGEVKAEISQYPLRLAWAITVHKSQGMSLDAAKINLARCFEPGMGYVALSRVSSLAGIKLLGFNEMALKVNQEVLKSDQSFKRKSKQIEKELERTSSKKISEKQKDFLKSVQEKKKNESRGKDKNKSDSENKAYSVEKIRKKHPSAYKKWNDQEEKTLIEHYKNGKNIQNLAQIMDRTKGSIRSRLNKIAKEAEKEQK